MSALLPAPVPHPPAEVRDPTHPAEARMYTALRAEAPHLVEGFLRCLPRACVATTRRLVAALWREDVAGIRRHGRILRAGEPLPEAPLDPLPDWLRPDSSSAPPCGAPGARARHRREVPAGSATGSPAAPADGPPLGLLGHARPGAWAVAELPRAAGALAFPVLAQHAFAQLHVGQPVLHLGAGEPRPLTHPCEIISLLSTADGTADAVDASRAGAPGTSGDDLAWDRLGAELADGAANLALAMARSEHAGRTTRRAAAALGARDCLELTRMVAARDAAFEPTVFLEKLCTEGHNLHPCARTRLGMEPGDLLRHDVESVDATTLVLVAVRRAHVHSTPDPRGRDVGELLLDAYPRLAAEVEASGLSRAEFVFLPVHVWQLGRVIETRYAEEITNGDVVPVPSARLRAEPTVALRTLLTEPAPSGRRYFVKTALDVQVTSTRRTISVQTATNGPAFSLLLDRIVAAEPTLARRVVLLPELAGASYRGDRSLTALVRADLAGRLRLGEAAVPGCALYGRSPLSGRDVLAEVVDRYAASRDEPRPDLAALLFLDDYAGMLLGATLRLMSKYGVGLEAHLQNTVPTFVDGVPTRVAFRDWGGMRVHLPRLAHRGHRPGVRAGSLTATRDVAVMRSKVAYTVLQNNLGELVARLCRSHGLDEQVAWGRIRVTLVGVFAELRAEAARDGDTRLARDAAADARAMLAPTLPHKALVSMRLHPDGRDRYVDVDNPLWRAP